MLSFAHTLLRIFPPPRFLVVPAAGLTISDRTIRFAELARRDGSLVLAHFGETEIPDGVFVAGKMKDSAALKTYLSEFKKKCRLREVHVALPDEESYLFRVKIPLLPRRDIRLRLLSEIEKNVPLQKDEVSFDYEETSDGSEEMSVTVLPAKTVSEYLSLFRESGFFPVSFELEAHALARALIAPDENGARMIIDVGKTRTSVIVVRAGIVLFTATITMGGDILTNAVAKRFGVSPGEACRQKKRLGLKKNSEGGMDMVNALIPPLSTLRDEIKRYYGYWLSSAEHENNGVSQKLEKIIIAGEDACVPGLRNYLASSLKEELEVANPWKNINPLSDYTPALQRSDSLRYAGAFGLALRSF